MPRRRNKTKNFHGERRNNFRGGNHSPVHVGSTDRMSPHELDPGPSAAPQNVASSDNVTAHELDPEPSAASQNVVISYNVTAHELGSDSSASGKNDLPSDYCTLDQNDCERICASLSQDSGFTSSSKSGSAQDETVSSDMNLPERDRVSQSTSILNEIGIELKQELPKAVALPKRPGFGTLGKRINLITNCYPLNVPDGNVYHYDVEVIRIGRNSKSCDAPGGEKRIEKYRCLKTREKRRVIELMTQRDSILEGLYPAYDGEKNLYTRKPLSAPFPHVFTTDDGDEICARVEIKPVKKENSMSCAISLDAIHSYFDGQSDSVPLEAITALEIILRHVPCLMSTPIGRSFFSPPGPGCLNPLAGGLEIWHGYHQSVRICQWQPTVNLDISATPFYRGGALLEYLAGFLDTTVDALRDTPFIADRDRRRLNRKLKDKKIETTHSHLRRKYTIIELVRESALALRLEEGGQTIARYFKERYKIDLEYPNLPCLRVGPKDRRVYIPVELCKLIPGQHYNSELTRAQKSEMIKFTSCPPKQRFQKISQILQFTNDRCVEEFGLTVSEDPLSVEGRILDPPSILYRGDKKIRPKDDAWNMRDVQFISGAKVGSWVLAAFRSMRRGTLDRFGKFLKEMGLKLGLDINDPSHTEFIDGQDIKRFMRKMKDQKADLIMFVIPESNEVYRDIKKSAETVVGLATQCILEKTVLRIVEPRSRCAAQLVTNLFLKINVKMEGLNYSLVLSEIPSILWKPVIIMGADVNHPGSYRGVRESLAACSGSLDARCSKYAVRTQPQKNPDVNKNSTEIISDLQLMVKELLRAFYRHTRNKPEKIIFYRDGVSEGEFLKVRDKEVASIRCACSDLEAEYKPGITYVVVQKRHHVRLMTEDSKLNARPGTVIDKGVSHPENFDFFLCSHNSPKGTAKPPHYTVLADDNEFKADDIQKLTNQLCYCYARCTKSISIPAPVAYAHLAAYRARQYLDAGREGSSANSSVSLPQEDPVSLEEAIACTTVVKEMINRMYFV